MQVNQNQVPAEALEMCNFAGNEIPMTEMTMRVSLTHQRVFETMSTTSAALENNMHMLVTVT